jgi:hypothetical protein
MGLFGAVHFVLVLLLVRGRIEIPPPLSGPWLDALTITCAFCFGPIAWHLAWKKAQVEFQRQDAEKN